MKSSMTKAISIDGRPLAGPQNGFRFYTTAIIQTLLDAGWQVELLTNRPLDQTSKLVARCQIAQFGPTNDRRWEQQALPDFLQQHQVPLYFSGANRGIPRRPLPHTRTVLGLLDVIPWQLPRLYIWKYPWHFLRHELVPQRTAIKQANAIITISQASAHDITARFDLQSID